MCFVLNIVFSSLSVFNPLLYGVFVLLLLLLLTTFTHGIYSYVPETNHVSRVHIQCCSCSVFTVCATCNVISHAQYVLHLYISTTHSAQYGCFLQLLNFTPSRYVAQVLSQSFSDGSSRPYYYRYHFCIYKGQIHRNVTEGFEPMRRCKNTRF